MAFRSIFLPKKRRWNMRVLRSADTEAVTKDRALPMLPWQERHQWLDHFSNRACWTGRLPSRPSSLLFLFRYKRLSLPDAGSWRNVDQQTTAIVYILFENVWWGVCETSISSTACKHFYAHKCIFSPVICLTWNFWMRSFSQSTSAFQTSCCCLGAKKSALQWVFAVSAFQTSLSRDFSVKCFFFHNAWICVYRHLYTGQVQAEYEVWPAPSLAFNEF